jgi:hypothetical protein
MQSILDFTQKLQGTEISTMLIDIGDCKDATEEGFE